MRVLLDASAIRDDRNGVARRLLSLWPRVIERTKDLEPDFIVHPQFAASIRGRFPRCGVIETKTGALSPIGRAVLHVPFLNRMARRLGVDIIFQETWPIADPSRTVVTIHDLRFLDRRLGGSVLRSLYARMRMPHILARARGVITVSRAVASNLEVLLGVPADKIRVVPNGVDSHFFGRGEATCDVLGRFELAAGGYFLVVGHREPRKNLETIVDLAATWKEKGRSERFVIVGRRLEGYDAPERAVAKRGLERTVLFLDEVADLELVALYHGASALLAPSLIEGFCLPILEAMASSTPVIAPKAPPYDEVAGERAVVGRPTSIADWTSEMLELESPSARERAVVAGKEQVAKYGWDRAAANLAEMIERF